MLKHILKEPSALRAPWEALVASLDDAGLTETLVEELAELEALKALPEGLHPVVATYLDTLPGYREGDRSRAAEQHRLRWELWQGLAMVVDATDLAALGLSAEDPSDG